MLKSLMMALASGAVAVTAFAVAAQAHHRVGHCIPGIVTAGCPVTPQAPQMPRPGK